MGSSAPSCLPDLVAQQQPVLRGLLPDRHKHPQSKDEDEADQCPSSKQGGQSLPLHKTFFIEVSQGQGSCT